MEMMVWALLCVVGEDASWARHDLMSMTCSDGDGDGDCVVVVVT